MIISSQRYLDDNIVATKQDYTVMITPAITISDIQYQIVLDGHHSLAAAQRDGVEPNYYVATEQDNDVVYNIHNPDLILELCYIDSDYYDINTGLDIIL
jgi:hypothetical protein